MPAPIRRRKPRAIRRVPAIRRRAIRRNVQPEIVHLVRHHPSSSHSSSSSRSLSSSSSNSSQSSRSHSSKHRRSQKRSVFPSLRRRSSSVIPLYGTNGTVIVGYVRPCRTGVKLCPRNG